MAAFGRKGLAQAARRGLPYLASPIETFDQIRENLAHHKEGLVGDTASGRFVIPVMRTVFISDRPASRERVVRALEAEGGGAGAPARQKLPAAVARAVAAPVDQRIIVGDAEEVKERLGAYRNSLGMNLLVVRPQIAGAEENERRASFDALVGEVMPDLNK